MLLGMPVGMLGQMLLQMVLAITTGNNWQGYCPLMLRSNKDDPPIKPDPNQWMATTYLYLTQQQPSYKAF